MSDNIKSFSELDENLYKYAGGKGKMLAVMAKKGFPVPDGFILLSTAFKNEQLKENEVKVVNEYLKKLKSKHGEALFAVRSSALNEDSEKASFAGEFETVLSVRPDDILKAIETVHQSKDSERVKSYSNTHKIEDSHEMAVVIQIMINSEISGVLFTADPVTGSFNNMVGNFVYGLGEQLVSGEANAHSFKISRPKAKYNGDNALKKYSHQLYKLSLEMENETGKPQDIEWAVADNNLYILQARPITTLSPGNLDNYEINDSLTGDFLWTNTNIGEAMADIFTPLSWSVIRMLDEEQTALPGYYLFSGNICGKAYTNLSMGLSLAVTFGVSMKYILKKVSGVFGNLPQGINVPVYPFAKIPLLKVAFPRILHRIKKLSEANKDMDNYLKNNPAWCKEMIAKIQKVKTKDELLKIWDEQLKERNFRALWGTFAGGRKVVILFKLNDQLTDLVGLENATTLLSNFRGNSELESLGPVNGISKILSGEISRQQYQDKYGHRGPHEFELSIPDSTEENEWLDKQIEEFKNSEINVSELLKNQQSQYNKALKELREKYPSKAKSLQAKIEKASEYARLRERVRSEWTRVFRVNRAFAKKSGELTGINDDIYFLYINEVIEMLSGENIKTENIPARKENYEKYKSLPPFPTIINGRFNPDTWLTDPNRRLDYYDPDINIISEKSDKLTGFAGASGRIQGTVRILNNPYEEFNKGEILVTSTTNVGWTPLFPKASAIITDIGAPLSHAAIVARELGIPAVVGCNNATSVLKTGNKVIVDGGKGIVEILKD